MNALSRLRTTVTSITEPADTHVGWIDVSNADSPVLKIYSNGEWKPLSSSGGGSDSLEFIVMENSEWLKASFDHEKWHLVMHISSALSIDPYSEEYQYLAGEVGKRMFKVAKKFLCDHCKQYIL